MYLELGWEPISYLLKSRRLLYLKYILNESNQSLIYNFLRAQWENPLRGDWIITVKDDLKELKLDCYTFDQIRLMSKDKFRSIVNTAVNKAAFQYLIEKKRLQSKISHIEYNSLSMQQYLRPGTILNSTAKYHFKARSSMLDLRGNFKNNFKNDNFCQGCLNRSEPETQMHTYYCNSLSSSEIQTSNVQYDDLFSQDSEKQLIVSQSLKKRIEKRNQLIKSREETNPNSH